MIIKIEENIKSFSSWTNMVKANAEKIKGFGATIIFAGVSKEDPTKFTVIVKYATMAVSYTHLTLPTICSV